MALGAGGAGAGSGENGPSRKLWIIIAVIVAIIFIIVVGLIGGSFKGLNYYEYGFIQDVSTGEVKTDKVYTGGLYMIGPNKKFKIFQADAHFVNLEDLNVGTLSGNDIEITVYFQYLLKESELHLLHDAYNFGYDDIVLASATEAIKQNSVQFENIQFLRERELVETTLLRAVKDRIHSKCCPKECDTIIDPNQNYFCEVGCIPFSSCDQSQMGLHVHVYDLQLGHIRLPSDLRERYLNALLLQAKIETTELKKNETIIIAETEVLVDAIKNQATEINVNATTDADLIVARATSDAKGVLEEAKLNGITKVYKTLNITNVNTMTAINYLRNLQTMHNSHFSVNYQYLVNSP